MKPVSNNDDCFTAPHLAYRKYKGKKQEGSCVVSLAQFDNIIWKVGLIRYAKVRCLASQIKKKQKSYQVQ